MTPVDFDPAADRQACRRYALTSARTAAGFHTEFWRTVGLISRTPTAFAPHLRGTRVLHFRRFPYHVISDARPSLVVTVAVAHDARRPGYWLRRLP